MFSSPLGLTGIRDLQVKNYYAGQGNIRLMEKFLHLPSHFQDPQVQPGERPQETNFVRAHIVLGVPLWDVANRGGSKWRSLSLVRMLSCGVVA